MLESSQLVVNNNLMSNKSIGLPFINSGHYSTVKDDVKFKYYATQRKYIVQFT